MSKVGKKILLKAVIMFLPNYVISFFRLSNKLGKKIKSLMAQFSWGDIEGRGKKMHWIS